MPNPQNFPKSYLIANSRIDLLMVFILGLHASWDKCEKTFLLFCSWVPKDMLSFSFLIICLGLLFLYFHVFPTFILLHDLQWKSIADEVGHPETRNKEWKRLGEELSLRIFALENSCKEYCTYLFIFQLSLFFFFFTTHHTETFIKMWRRSPCSSSMFPLWWMFVSVISRNLIKACQNSIVDRNMI